MSASPNHMYKWTILWLTGNRRYLEMLNSFIIKCKCYRHTVYQKGIIHTTAVEAVGLHCHGASVAGDWPVEGCRPQGEGPAIDRTHCGRLGPHSVLTRWMIFHKREKVGPGLSNLPKAVELNIALVYLAEPQPFPPFCSNWSPCGSHAENNQMSNNNLRCDIIYLHLKS